MRIRSRRWGSGHRSPGVTMRCPVCSTMIEFQGGPMPSPNSRRVARCEGCRSVHALDGGRLETLERPSRWAPNWVEAPSPRD